MPFFDGLRFANTPITAQVSITIAQIGYEVFDSFDILLEEDRSFKD
jgi:hypothetical protein